MKSNNRYAAFSKAVREALPESALLTIEQAITESTFEVRPELNLIERAKNVSALLRGLSLAEAVEVYAEDAGA